VFLKLRKEGIAPGGEEEGGFQGEGNKECKKGCPGDDVGGHGNSPQDRRYVLGKAVEEEQHPPFELGDSCCLLLSKAEGHFPGQKLRRDGLLVGERPVFPVEGEEPEDFSRAGQKGKAEGVWFSCTEERECPGKVYPPANLDRALFPKNGTHNPFLYAEPLPYPSGPETHRGHHPEPLSAEHGNGSRRSVEPPQRLLQDFPDFMPFFHRALQFFP
jgi:hypothetical protein